MKTRFLLAFLAILPFAAMSQEVSSGKETPYIEVVGTAEMEVAPDQIYISFTLKERMDGKKKIEKRSENRFLFRNAKITMKYHSFANRQ